jgi:hypothetical protein
LNSSGCLYVNVEFLKISVDLQTEFAAETHRAEGQWLEEQLSMVKLRMFRVGTRMPTASAIIQFNSALFPW